MFFQHFGTEQVFFLESASPTTVDCVISNTVGHQQRPGPASGLLAQRVMP
jgi:hypothetical protein